MPVVYLMILFLKACALVAIFCCLGLILFVEPHAVAYSSVMTIDGLNYLRAGQEMVSKGNWIVSAENYHSAGMQILSSWIFRIFGFDALAVKLFNFICYIISLFLIFNIGAFIGFSLRKKWLSVVLLATSSLVIAYCATSQYEIFAMLVILAAAFSYFNEKPLIFGLLSALLLLFRLHLFWMTLPFWLAFLLAKERRDLIQATAGFFVLFLPLYVLYFSEFGTINPFQHYPFDFYKNWLCLGAEGWEFPHFNFTENSVCGYNFIVQHPTEYLKMLVKRAKYATGLRPDIWWVSRFFWIDDKSLKTQADSIYVAAALMLFGVRIKQAIKEKNRPAIVISSTIFCAILPLFIFGASTRYFVPLIPFFILTIVSARLQIKTK